MSGRSRRHQRSPLAPSSHRAPALTVPGCPVNSHSGQAPPCGLGLQGSLQDPQELRGPQLLPPGGQLPAFKEPARSPPDPGPSQNRHSPSEGEAEPRPRPPAAPSCWRLGIWSLKQPLLLALHPGGAPLPALGARACRTGRDRAVRRTPVKTCGPRHLSHNLLGEQIGTISNLLLIREALLLFTPASRMPAGINERSRTMHTNHSAPSPAAALMAVGRGPRPPHTRAGKVAQEAALGLGPHCLHLLTSAPPPVSPARGREQLSDSGRGGLTLHFSCPCPGPSPTRSLCAFPRAWALRCGGTVCTKHPQATAGRRDTWLGGRRG